MVVRNTKDLAPNPTINELAAIGSGKFHSITGFVGPATAGRMRLYPNLALSTYIEIDDVDIIRVGEAPPPLTGANIVYFRSEAEILYVQTTTMRASAVLAAVMAASSGSKASCGCGEAGESEVPGSIARQNNQGPAVDICTWSCSERLGLCHASPSSWRWWC